MTDYNCQYEDPTFRDSVQGWTCNQWATSEEWSCQDAYDSGAYKADELALLLESCPVACLELTNCSFDDNLNLPIGSLRG